MRGGRGLRFLLIVLSINLISGSLGPISTEWSRGFAVSCLVALLLVTLRFPFRPRSRLRAFAGIVGFLGVCVLMGHLRNPVLGLALVSVGVWIISRVIRELGGCFRSASTYVVAAWFYAALTALYSGLPYVHEAGTICAIGWTQFLGQTIVRQPLVNGPSGVGLGVLASVVCFLLVGLVRGLERPRQRKRLIWLLAGVPFAHALFVWLQNQPSLLAQDALTLFLSQAMFLCFCAVLAGAVWRTGDSWRGPRVGKFGWACAVGLLFVGSVGLVMWPMGRDKPRGTILFHDDGLLDWNRPVFGKYGPMDSGMFGSLHDYLGAASLSCQISKQISGERLKGADTLVIINPTNHLAGEELKAIWAFVGNGGSLLVLGDHTDIMGSRDCLNTLLAPVNGSFNFDAGIAAHSEWGELPKLV